MPVTVTSIGNAGFAIATPESTVLVDAFYRPFPAVAEPPALTSENFERIDAILVTHAHLDHFAPAEVAAAAKRTGATVFGPASVTAALAGELEPHQLRTLEPPMAAMSWAQSESATVSFGEITAFRTFHSPDHNSYLVQMGEFRFFHDGDNGLTHRYAPGSLGSLDALFIGPWQGSGWAEFVEKMAPKRYFLMHLLHEELEETLRGGFLPEICDRVPQGLVVLRPGQSYRCE